MRGITVRQPWAHAIATGHKNVENRFRPHPWRSAVGEVLALHSSLGTATTAVRHPAMLNYSRALRAQTGHTESGAILATVRLVDVHRARGDGCCHPTYAQPDCWHLVLDDVRPLTVPIGCRGALGLWTVPDEVERGIAFQLTTIEDARDVLAELANEAQERGLYDDPLPFTSDEVAG